MSRLENMAVVRRKVWALADDAFDAWVNPAVLSLWMFGQTPGETVVRMETEPWEGGNFSFVVNRGGQEVNHIGTYVVFTPPHSLTFTWSVEGIDDVSIVSVALVEADLIGTEVVVMHAMASGWESFVPQAEQSWGLMLDCLVAHFAPS